MRTSWKAPDVWRRHRELFPESDLSDRRHRAGALMIVGFVVQAFCALTLLARTGLLGPA